MGKLKLLVSIQLESWAGHSQHEVAMKANRNAITPTVSPLPHYKKYMEHIDICAWTTLSFYLTICSLRQKEEQQEKCFSRGTPQNIGRGWATRS